MEPLLQNNKHQNGSGWIVRGLILLLVFASGWWGSRQYSALRFSSEQAESQSRQPGVDYGAALSLNNPLQLSEGNQQTYFQQLLASNQIDAAIGFLRALDPGSGKALWSEQLMYQHLSGLMQNQQWPKLDAWITELLQLDSDNTLYQDLAIDSALVQGDRLAALSKLFVAYDSALDEQRRQACRQRIDMLLENAYQQARSESPGNLEQNRSLMDLLRVALEKQPDYPPFGLMMADVLADSGELEDALYQVQLLPYSEGHQAQVDAKIHQLELAISNREQSRSGVPLYRNADHFVVNVLFGGEVELHLMIDTGASITALTPAAIARLQQSTNLADTGQVLQVHTANGQVAAPLYQIDSMQIENRVQHQVNILEVNLSNDQVDGLLGMNFLGQYAFSIDQNLARLYLMESQSNPRNR